MWWVLQQPLDTYPGPLRGVSGVLGLLAPEPVRPGTGGLRIPCAPLPRSLGSGCTVGVEFPPGSCLLASGL